MDKVKFSELNKDEMFLHFTPSENIPSIARMGLLPKVGENARGDGTENSGEKKPKSFFAKGIEGCNEILNVWIKWVIFKKQETEYLKNPEGPQDDAYKRMCFNNDALDNKLETPEVKEWAFGRFHEFLSCHSYLSLDLKEGIDFDYNDEDEIKTKFVNDKAWLEMMYGKVQNMDGLERWNLHTKVGHVVPPEKITEVTDQQGRTDALSVVKELYELSKDKELDIPLLDEFMEYEKQRELEKEEKQNSEINNDEEEIGDEPVPSGLKKESL